MRKKASYLKKNSSLSGWQFSFHHFSSTLQASGKLICHILCFCASTCHSSSICWLLVSWSAQRPLRLPQKDVSWGLISHTRMNFASTAKLASSKTWAGLVCSFVVQVGWMTIFSFIIFSSLCGLAQKSVANHFTVSLPSVVYLNFA